jgi:hypothetical protein
VNVDELQLHLSDLGQLLRNAGGRKTADALAEFCQRLQPYRDRRVRDLVDLLDKAEAIIRTGEPPPRTKTRSAKVDPQAVEQLCNRIVDLYHRAKEPDTTREQIESAFGELERLNLSVAQLQDLARRIDISQRVRSKKPLLESMKRAVLERRGALQRVQV